MAKNLENLVVITDGSSEKTMTALDEGKTVLFSAEKGEHVLESIKNGFSLHYNASLEVASETDVQGICGCGKPANVMLYFWRD